MSENPYQPPNFEKLTEPAYSEGKDFIFKQGFKAPDICFLSGVALTEGSSSAKRKIGSKLYLKHPHLPTFLILICIFCTSVASSPHTSFSVRVLLFSLLLTLLTILVIYSLKLDDVEIYGHQTAIKKSRRINFAVSSPAIIGSCLLLAGAMSDIHIHIGSGLVIFIAGLSIHKNCIAPKAISKHGDYYRLRGAHPDFLAHFPAVPR